VVDGLTKLLLAADLENTYKNDTVVINANVAAATHGETTGEILGSGDSTAPFQAFALRQPPLTHVSASTPSGTETTLEVHVNDLLWSEASSLYGHGPEKRIYTTRTADDGVTTIQFGDGLTGARLPTGTENIRAEYRKGIGLEGLVKAGQISQLLSMPLGLKGVTNPVAASGAQDMESLSEARHNAPLTVLTLDRVVSLKDYEDFARSFAGIAKALATWTWDGEKRGVFITVAGPGGSEIKRGTKVYDNLLASLRDAGDSRVPIAIESYRSVHFRLGGRIKVQAEYRPETVLENVERELRERFAFDARSFGQPVFLSEVIAMTQRVAGVVAVFVDRLYRTDEAVVGKKPKSQFKGVKETATIGDKAKGVTGRQPSVALGAATTKYRDRIDAWWRKYTGERVTDVDTFLEAAVPQAGETGVLAAELLTLDLGPLGLEVVS
jgi:predicted phage baseplate assembly protein